MMKVSANSVYIISIFLVVTACFDNTKTKIPKTSDLKLDPRSQIIALEKYTSKHEKDKTLHFKLAKLYFSNQNVDSALIHITQATSLDPNNNEYNFLQAQCFALKGLFLDSKDAFEKVSEAGIPMNDYISLAADIYFNTNNYNKALNYLERAIAENPNSPFLYFKKGIIIESRGDTLQAIENFKRSIQLDPSYIEAYIEWAELETKRKNFKEVKNYLVKALNYDTLNSNLYFQLALAYKNLDKKDSSTFFYEKSIKFDSNNVNALYNISIIYLQKGKYASAEKYLKKVSYLKPETKNLNFKIAVALDYLDKHEEALNYYQKIDSSDINYNFAQRLIKKIKIKTKQTAVVEQEQY